MGWSTGFQGPSGVISPDPECIIRMNISWFLGLWNKSYLVEWPFETPFLASLLHPWAKTVNQNQWHCPGRVTAIYTK